MGKRNSRDAYDEEGSSSNKKGIYPFYTLKYNIIFDCIKVIDSFLMCETVNAVLIEARTMRVQG